MSFSDETLMAYADGELDEATRLAVEAAMRRDGSIARRVARLRAARDEVYADQGPSGGRSRQAAKVVQLASVRAQRVATQQAARKAIKRRWGWREWSALALVMMLGLAAGKFGLAHWQPRWLGAPATAPSELASRDGTLVAQGKLDAILNQQLGGAAPSEGNVRVGLSFLSKEGGYCRSFTLVGGNQDLVGLACRASDEWRVPVLVQNTRPQPAMGAYRMAGTEMPTAVLEAIDQRIVGGMLDTRAEVEALRRSWQR
jgi:hypothetical protein